MDVKRRRQKKRKTRRELDDLRKRLHDEEHNKVNPVNENILSKTIPKYNNAIMKGKLTSFELFNKTVRSKTACRVPLSKINNIQNVKDKMSNAFTNFLFQPQNTINGICKNHIIQRNINNTSVSQTLDICRIGDESEGVNRVSSCYPPHNEYMNLKQVISEEFNYMHNYSRNSSGSNSGTDSDDCQYEKFMNELPIYLKEHFPALTSNFQNRNIMYLKKIYFENGYQENTHNTLTCIKYSNISIPENHREPIIQDPMNYIRSGSTWEHSVKRKQSTLVSNSPRLSLPEFLSNTSDIFLNSPEYIYFPHKMNQ